MVPFRSPFLHSQSAQEWWRGSGLLRSRKRWCKAGASSSLWASKRKLVFSEAYSAHLV